MIFKTNFSKKSNKITGIFTKTVAQLEKLQTALEKENQAKTKKINDLILSRAENENLIVKNQKVVENINKIIY